MKKLLLIIFSFTTAIVCVFTNDSSAQGSITWTTGMNIASNTYGNMHPRITTDAAGNPLVIWGRMSDASVFISRWNGTAFTMPVKVNPAWLTIATAAWMGPDIAAKGDTVYVVMKRTPEPSDTSHIYITRSFDGGITFSAPVQVDFIADSVSRFPTVTTDNAGNPIVGFMKFDPGFGNARWAVTASNDFGNTFSSDVKASGWSGAGAAVCDCCPGALLKTGNTVAMLYRDNLSNIRDMWAGISTDGGNSFTQGMPLDQGNWMIMMCPSSGPDGTIIGDTLYTTYMSGAGGNTLVYLSKSGISSLTGASGNPLTGTFPGLASQNFPRIASSQNALAVVWKQSVNGADQLALRFTNNIAAGFPAAYDTVDLNDITNADVALTDGNIFIVWEDDNSGTVKYRHGTFTSTTGVPENKAQNLFFMYPNPVNGALNFKSPSLGWAAISVYNLTGEKIYSENVFLSAENKLDFSPLSNGMYFLKIQNENFSESIKFIKE
ncbi:MAG TPA: T9SS type A sorting domain-containing protein [Bacteroidia bacterium]|nr:T9SS type A sorting domain-containing protein [Bacteroidia bacterium]